MLIEENLEADKKSIRFKNGAAFLRMIIPMILGLVLCAGLFITCTWAWFNTTLSYTNNKIESSVFVVDIDVIDENDDPVESQNGDYQLSAGKTYDITLESSGTCETGYVKLVVSDTTYYHQFSKEEPDVFTFIVNVGTDDSTVRIKDFWGTSANDHEEILDEINIG